MTAEKEKAPVDDRAFIHAKTQQVLEELARLDGFADLLQKGLKSMTHKQFIMILQHFMMPIAGNVKLDGTNYVEYISNFLNTMDYPYTINKSSLKTPSAPHCQNSIIILLAWFTEFSVKDDGEQLVKNSLTDDFTSPEISTMFMSKAAKAFELWNNQEEVESDGIMQEIRQIYIEQKIGKDTNLQDELSRLKGQIEQLKKEGKPLSVQKDYIDKRDELKQLVQQCEELRNGNKDLLTKISDMKASLEVKRLLTVKAEQELQALRVKLAKQKMTLEERNLLLMEISQAKSVLASKKQSAMELYEASSENEIQLSKLIQKKFYLIDKLNNFIYKLASDLEIAGMKGKFDPAEYEIKTTKVANALGLVGEIEQWNRGLIVLQKQYLKALDLMAQSIVKLSAEKHQLITENAMVLAELENHRLTIEQMNAEEVSIENDLQIYINTMEQNIHQNSILLKKTTEEIEVLKKRILRYREVNAKISADHKAFKEKSLEQCKLMYERRQQEVKLQRQKLNEMNQILLQFEKVQKPFPDNVQNTINEVMKKRVGGSAEHNS